MLQKNAFWLRRVLMTLLVCLAFAGTAYAAEVTATGQGSTERNALHDAMRSAIEKSIGTYIDSRTYTENYQVLNDRIYAQTEGYIQNYIVLKSGQKPGGFWEVTIKAEVKEQALRTDLMTYVQKRAVIGANMQDPRIGVMATDSEGNTDLAFENALISGLQGQGFTRLIDLKQIGASVKKRLAAADAAGDASLRTMLQNQFHVDYLVTAQVDEESKGIIPKDNAGLDPNVINALEILIPEVGNMQQASISASVRMMNVNTGEIIYAGSASEKAKGKNGAAQAKATITGKIMKELSKAALKKAANPEQHITILVTGSALGSMSQAYQRLSAVPGVSHVFTRSQSGGNMQIDVDYLGTAYDLAAELERSGIAIKEMNSEYIKL
ncbi:MAG: hypothetical protein IJ849_02105 [Selenomonadaceae bacterium]|nr:hypothetical protein [Selenomonadaceae bacterium]